jgi:hypothetical protein
MSLMLLGILNSQAAGGGGGAYDLLETTISNGSTNSITFSSINTLAADYTHLQLRMITRYQNTTNSLQRNSVRLNGDSGSNYSVHTLLGDGSTVTSTAFTSTNRFILEEQLPGNGTTTGIFGAAVIDILDFASTSKNTTMRSLHGAVAGSENAIALASSAYLSTNAVTSIEITSLNDSWVSGSRFSLFGLKGN